MQIYDIAIIGGGAAGLMAAATLCQNKKTVLIERNPALGRKILVTGNGRCNISNKFTAVSNYHGANNNFIDCVLKQFDQNAAINFFVSHGLKLKQEDNGRMFPQSDNAQSVIDLFTQILKTKNMDLKLDSLVKNIKKAKNFEIELKNKQKIFAKKIILTTGGKSMHVLGSSGDGYFWAQNFGHKISALYPALTPLESNDLWLREIAGLKVFSRVQVKFNDKILRQKEGDLLFTHYGLSGPAAMAQAGAIGPILNESPQIEIDFLPNITKIDFDAKLKTLINSNGAKQIKTLVGEFVPQNLAHALIAQLNVNPYQKAAEISKADRLKIVEILKNTKVNISGVKNYKYSQVTAGGIEVDQIDCKTMQSKITPNLFFAGEILDVDGDSGGFNLQWAWSSGFVAAQAASKN